MVALIALALVVSPDTSVQGAKRVSIFGAVQNPQFFTYDTPPSAFDVLTQAGPDPKAGDTICIRSAKGAVEVIPRAASQLKSRKLADRDVLYVPFLGTKNPGPLAVYESGIKALATGDLETAVRTDTDKLGTIVHLSDVQGPTGKPGVQWTTISNSDVLVALPRKAPAIGSNDLLVFLSARLAPQELGRWTSGDLYGEFEAEAPVPAQRRTPEGKDIVVFGQPTAASEWRALKWSPDLTVEDCLGLLAAKPEFVFLDNPSGKVPERVKPDRFATLRVPPGSTLIVPGHRPALAVSSVTVVLINGAETSMYRGKAGTLKEVIDKALAVGGDPSAYTVFVFKPISGEKPVISGLEVASTRKLAPGSFAILYTRSKD